jgi:cysteine desulfurase family protein
MSLDTAVRVYEAREAAGSLFGTENPENVVFTQNCTHALNLAIKGFVCAGEHVIISDLEHNSVLRPVHTLAERGVITYNIAKIHPGRDERTLAEFEALIRPNTSLIVCTHGSNVWGIRTPVEKLGALAAAHGLFFLVDAAQTAGVIPIDIKKCGIDLLCMSGHKSLYGPSGTGLMITHRPDALSTIIEGGTGSFSADYSQPEDMPDRFECGTVNTAGIMGLGAGIRYIAERGIETIRRHEMSLWHEIHRRLSKMPNVELYDPLQGNVDNQLPVLAFNIKGMHSEDVTAKLSDAGFALRGGLHCSPLAHEKMGTLERGAARISIGIFNTESHAAALCHAIKKLDDSA